jgi:hypothetical protein
MNDAEIGVCVYNEFNYCLQITDMNDAEIGVCVYNEFNYCLQITDMNDAEIGVLTKVYPGLLKECCTSADTYEVSCKSPLITLVSTGLHIWES